MKRISFGMVGTPEVFQCIVRLTRDTPEPTNASCSHKLAKNTPWVKLRVGCGDIEKQSKNEWFSNVLHRVC